MITEEDQTSPTGSELQIVFLGDSVFLPIDKLSSEMFSTDKNACPKLNSPKCDSLFPSNVNRESKATSLESTVV